MKIQKILEEVDPNSRAYLIKQSIVSRLYDMKAIKQKIAKNEQDLFFEVKSIFQQDASLKEYYPFFNLMVLSHRDDAPYNDTLLNAVCLQVAQSLVNLFDHSEEKGNAFVNYGGRHLTVSQVEISKNFIIEGNGKLHGFFEKFNEVMKPYDVRIKQLNNTASDISPLSIHIRILK